MCDSKLVCVVMVIAGTVLTIKNVNSYTDAHCPDYPIINACRL